MIRPNRRIGQGGNRENRIHLHGEHCVYCGESPETRDHFPPISVTYLGYTLPACRECNCIAGTRFPFDFESRAKLVKESIKRKYKKALDTPDWSEEEFEDISYSIREMIKQWQRTKIIIQQRLAWSAAGYISSIDKLGVFAPVNAEANFTMMSEKELLNFLEEKKKEREYANKLID